MNKLFYRTLLFIVQLPLIFCLLIFTSLHIEAQQSKPILSTTPIQLPTPSLNPQSDPCQREAADDCAAAVVLTIDISGSMDNKVNDDTDTTVLDKVKSAATTVIGSIPPGQWKMGITTFPSESGAPLTNELLLVTDLPDTRQLLIDLINQLQPGGLTNILTGGYQALTLLQTDMERTRFLVFFSDGKICLRPDCSLVKEMADFIKLQNVKIATVGYNLNENESAIMKYIASDLPDGSKAFVNSASGGELFNDLKTMLQSLCRFLPLSLELKPNIVELGVEGSETVELNVKYHFGPRKEYRLVSYGGVINVNPTEEFITIGPNPSECIKSQKVSVQALASSNPGTYISGIFAWDTQEQATRASKSITAKVLTWNANVEFLETPTWTGGNYLGKIKIHSEATTNVPITISLLVRKINEYSTAEGWNIQLFPQNTATVGPGTDAFTITYQLTPPDDINWSETYTMEAIVTGLGRRFSSEREIVPQQ